MAVKKTNSRRELINLGLLLKNSFFHDLFAKLLGKVGSLNLLNQSGNSCRHTVTS
jgi:hypothetical protein